MTRKNLKVPESLFLALRDDKPDSLSWPAYLETRCLGAGLVGEDVRDQLDRIERAATTAEDRTGSIQRTLEEMGR